jgi:hypothetical protein
MTGTKLIGHNGSAVPGPGHNSNEDLEARLELHVATHHGFKKQEGQYYVLGCKAVVEAEADLPEQFFDRYCERIHLPRNSSKFRKARTIGKAADQLLAVSDRLPDAKNTLYELAKVANREPRAFKELIENDVLTPQITAAEIAGPGVAAVKEDKCVIPVDATALTRCERLELLQEVVAIANRWGATISIPKPLRERQDAT